MLYDWFSGSIKLSVKRSNYMRKFIFLGAIILSSSLAHAESNTQLLDCMDKQTLTLNATCVAENIEQSDQFKRAQQNIITVADANSDYAVATISLDPKTLNIEIVAHHDAKQTALLAKPVR